MFPKNNNQDTGLLKAYVRLNAEGLDRRIPTAASTNENGYGIKPVKNER
jgi:hypothetical protein